MKLGLTVLLLFIYVGDAGFDEHRSEERGMYYSVKCILTIKGTVSQILTDF